MSRNFSIILFCLILLTGFICLLEILILKNRRNKTNIIFDASIIGKKKHRKRSILIDLSVSFFPVFFVVFILRSFLMEPFRIPSGSMLPTLKSGDFILVNKFIYGFKLPIIDYKVISFTYPKRGDIIVFRDPVSYKLDYIKRVVAIPGDVVNYSNKTLSINNEKIITIKNGLYYDNESMLFYNVYKEFISDTINYNILLNSNISNDIRPSCYFPYFDNCKYYDNGNTLSCIIPKGYYFVMGDNRDNSFDSRYWGFVPEKNIIGQAFFIWLNFHDISRIGYLN